MAKVDCITLHTSYYNGQIDLTEHSRPCGILFVKAFYNVINFIICSAREARALPGGGGDSAYERGGDTCRLP